MAGLAGGGAEGAAEWTSAGVELCGAEGAAGGAGAGGGPLVAGASVWVLGAGGDGGGTEGAAGGAGAGDGPLVAGASVWVLGADGDGGGASEVGGGGSEGGDPVTVAGVEAGPGVTCVEGTDRGTLAVPGSEAGDAALATLGTSTVAPDEGDVESMPDEGGVALSDCTGVSSTEADATTVWVVGVTVWTTAAVLASRS